MSRIMKLLERTRNNPKDVHFEDLDKLMLRAGFECRQPSGGSSHYTYTIEGCPFPTTVPRKNPVKTVYVKLVIARIEEFGNLE